MAGQDLHRIAMKAYAKGDLATAQRLYEKLIRLAPGDFNALHMLGVVRARQGRFKEAENLIARALLCGRSAVLFNCRTSLVATFRERFGDVFDYRENRALLLDPAQILPTAALVDCLTAALTYHKR